METRVSRYSSANTNRAGALRWPFILVGAVLCAFTVGNLIVGNSNLGTYLPAVAGLPLLVYGLLRPAADRWFSHGPGRIVKWILVSVYCAAIVVVAGCTIAIAVAVSTPPDPGADAVIVLGAAVHGDEVTDTLEKRLYKAMEYYEDNPETLLVVTGGMGSGENLSEAEAMRRFLVAHGIPDSSILVEDQASNTQENFEYSKALLDERFSAPAKIVYVTSDFHVLRAGAEARKAGFEDAQGLGAATPILTVPGAVMRESAGIMRGVLRGDFAAA